jgi:HD superfamily phosphodiesterase
MDRTLADVMQVELLHKMIDYYAGDAKRVQHFLKVYDFAKLIGKSENLPEDVQFLLEITAIVHDIGIKVSEEKYQSSAGIYQEKEGPAIAKPMLVSVGYTEAVIERSCYLIGHHHTYKDINGLDYQILVEADFLVNIYEDEISQRAIQSIKEKIFKTKTGIHLLETMYSC